MWGPLAWTTRLIKSCGENALLTFEYFFIVSVSDTATNEKMSLMVQAKDKEIEKLKQKMTETQAELDHSMKSLEQKENLVQQMKQELRDLKIQSEEAAQNVCIHDIWIVYYC